jgi:hypothetical protein
VAVALPALRRGLVWRIARPIDARVVRQAGEGEIGPSIVVVFSAVGRGDARIAFAATRGETRAALRSFVQRVHVR